MAATNNALNITSTGLVKYDGAGAFTATTTTNHNLLIGAASNAITNVAPSATSGVPVISQGSSSDPTFGTAVVAGGGTGNATQAAYSLVAGGTSTTGAFQAVGPDSSTHSILYGQGTSALPAFSTSGTPYVSGISFDSGTNTLSSYTHTSFTPALAFGGGTTGITYSTQGGQYFAIGSIVVFTVVLALTSKGSSTGNATITGFPFTAGAGLDFTYYIMTVNVSYPTSCTNTAGILVNAGTTMNLWGVGSSTFSNLTNTNFTNTSVVQFSGVYWH